MIPLHNAVVFEGVGSNQLVRVEQHFILYRGEQVMAPDLEKDLLSGQEPLQNNARVTELNMSCIL